MFFYNKGKIQPADISSVSWPRPPRTLKWVSNKQQNRNSNNV